MSDRQRRRVRVENANKRVRTYLGGELVADTTRPLLVWEKPYYPVYYFPAEDVRLELLTETGETKRSPSRGAATLYTVATAAAKAEGAAYRHLESPVEELRAHVAFTWGAMDSWFEEDEEVYVHARDPYTRVDILPSSRHIEVVIDGTKVADSRSARFLFETGLPTRYYLPKTDVRMDLLQPTGLNTECPYKGVASYYDVVVAGNRHENVVWWYPFPAEESSRIAGLVSFYNEKVDIYVDGELEDRPKTIFS
ncbi:MAG: DUF427 domain-containing protein [Acidimicrobiia bacterium]|nr:DUF427 domain-containing protein [Acidimicrobiia bacterium]